MILTLLTEKTDKKEKKESLGSGNDRSEAFFAQKNNSRFSRLSVFWVLFSFKLLIGFFVSGKFLYEILCRLQKKLQSFVGCIRKSNISF